LISAKSRRASRAACQLARAARVDGDAEDAGGATHDVREVVDGIELESLGDAEAIAQRRGQQAGSGGRTDQREARQVELDRARRRTFADHDVELVVLHGRVEDFLDDGAEPMNLVDEQHVVRFEIGQQRGEVARALEHRSRSLPQADAHLVGDDVRERRLAEPRWAEDQHVVERVAALACRADEDLHLLGNLRLADVVGQQARADGAVGELVVA
jgi:hypothetical protein